MKNAPDQTPLDTQRAAPKSRRKRARRRPGPGLQLENLAGLIEQMRAVVAERDRLQDTVERINTIVKQSGV
jgi:hypothetical protein